MTIAVAHDFICPWCWVGLFQARKLQQEFGATIEWRAYELFPEGMDYPAATAPEIKPRNRPETPDRFTLMLAAEGMTMPEAHRPRGIKTTNAHLACVAARDQGCEDALIEAFYRAYWERGESIDREEVVRKIVSGVVPDVEAVMSCVRRRCGMEEIVPYDDPAYATGVYNVPTFFIGGRRYAEQPYSVLADAVRHAAKANAAGDIYADLDLGPAPADRPYVVMDMVSTIDGKTVTGTDKDDVSDLGSAVDHALMKRIEEACDGVMVGAGTLRATTNSWVPVPDVRVVVTRGGDLPADAGFFHGGRSFVATSGSRAIKLPEGASIIRAGNEEMDFAALLFRLRSLGVERLLVLGGSELNAGLLRAGLVDELFLTVAPKIKLGRGLPTYAGGEPLARGSLLEFELKEHHVVGNEIFLRYRAKGGS